MKKLALFVTVLLGISLLSCTGKRQETKTEEATPAAAAAPDTIVVDYGTVAIDSINPDSAAIVVQDTTVEVIAEPETKDKK
ncbi:MAG: hypothetical protein Q4F97_03390 [Bacteroidales bacterium]|nr:hypothetical protein [Bacteroidales bacterium]